MRDNIMSKRWTEAEWLKLNSMRSQQHGHEDELPSSYLARKQRHHRKLIPIYPGATATELAFEVAELWLHTPPAWAAHIDVTLCPTSAELIKMATDREDQHLASSINKLTRLIQAELQQQSSQVQGAHWQIRAQLANVVEEEETEAGFPSLTVEAKAPVSITKEGARAPGKYPFPLASNCSKKVPPRPCRNCRSPLHYDRDCASWRSRGRPEGK
jgi:hypothetical protein